MFFMLISFACLYFLASISHFSLLFCFCLSLCSHISLDLASHWLLFGFKVPFCFGSRSSFCFSFFSFAFGFSLHFGLHWMHYFCRLVLPPSFYLWLQDFKADSRWRSNFPVLFELNLKSTFTFFKFLIYFDQNNNNKYVFCKKIFGCLFILFKVKVKLFWYCPLESNFKT